MAQFAVHHAAVKKKKKKKIPSQNQQQFSVNKPASPKTSSANRVVTSSVINTNLRTEELKSEEERFLPELTPLEAFEQMDKGKTPLVCAPDQEANGNSLFVGPETSISNENVNMEKTKFVSGTYTADIGCGPDH